MFGGFGKWRRLKDVTTGWWGDEKPAKGGGVGSEGLVGRPNSAAAADSAEPEPEAAVSTGKWLLMGADGKMAERERHS